jgi:hypothetical protein
MLKVVLHTRMATARWIVPGLIASRERWGWDCPRRDGTVAATG